MKAPKCKSCGKIEWQHICRPNPPVPDFVEFQKQRRETEMRHAIAPQPQFDRVAYQREYMRRYRAKKRLEQ